MEILIGPPKRIAVVLHAIFTSLYLLLLARLGISLYEGPSNLLHPIQPSVFTLITKRMAGIVYYPFFAVLLGPSLEGNAHLIVAIHFCIIDLRHDSLRYVYEGGGRESSCGG